MNIEREETKKQPTAKMGNEFENLEIRLDADTLYRARPPKGCITNGDTDRIAATLEHLGCGLVFCFSYVDDWGHYCTTREYTKKYDIGS